jgi:amino acid adenylation domain-containing protein
MSRSATIGSTREVTEGPASRPPEPTRAPAAEPRCVHRWIEARAARAPETIALACSGESLTYGELNARANRLARRLRALGVGPEVLVGLCATRSIDLVAALLAVLKAGGAYVPLDPAYPPGRLAFMLEDANLAVLLTQSDLLGHLPATSAKVIALDLDHHGREEADSGDLSGGAGLDNLAYVIYTSGSTGRPKGAMIHHRGLANYLAWATRAYAVHQGEGSPVHSSIAFDLTVTSLLAPLVAGRRVDLLDEDLGVEQLAAALRKARDYSLVKITPAHLRALGDQLGPADAAGRTRAFVIGGEQLTAEHVAFWREHAPETTLINEYGPTETVVGCCVYRMPRESSTSGPIPIGRPIANMRLYVLDRNFEPVPVGARGELYVGGPGVARGYLGRPGLTAERFVPDPFGAEPGGRLYRTGDLARWRSDGNLEYLGRVDRQVKIRGFRIEPAEIEETLARHPAIHEAVVVATADGSGDRRLAAYLRVAAGEPAPADSELRRFSRDWLPEPMIPSAYVVLETFPLTPNGKVDRQALPPPEAGRMRHDEFAVSRHGHVAEVVASIWGGLLGRARFDPEDDFFEVGGHSLLATQVVSRLRDAFGVELSLQELFENPTFAAVTGWIEERLRADTGVVIPPLEPIEYEGRAPVSFSQQSLWFLDQLAPGQATFNITIAARLLGPFDLEAFQRSLAELIRRHGTLRTTFANVDGRPVQVVAPAVELPMTTVDLRALDEALREAELRRRVYQQSCRPFDLAKGPLLRVQVLELGADANAILVTMHHIISDGWSFGVAARELTAIYDAFRRGAPSPLDPLPIQYTDYSLWQRRWLEGQGLDRLVGYWSRQLAGVTLLELPTDRPRPPIRSSRGALNTFVIPPERAQALQALCRREGATLYMVLLAALQTLLHRYTGQDDIVVGSPIANRNRSEVEGLIGYFINMLALRTDLSGDPSFVDLVRRVRNVALAAYEHQDLPFEKVIEALQPARDPSRTPIFQVMFVLQNQRIPDLSHPELVLSPLVIDQGTGTAKFDLTLSIEESDQGLFGGFEYSTDLFDSGTIVRMTRHFEALLEGVLADPTWHLSRFPVVLDEEQQQVLAVSRGCRRHPAETLCIHRLFEGQAEKTPHALAIVFEDQSLTYQQLNDRSNHLARELRERGVGPDVLVGLGMTRSLELAVGLLGVLKAGGAFVPLDPTYPAERLAGMLEDAGVAVLLTQEHLRERWPVHPAAVICLEAHPATAGGQLDTNVDGGATPEHAAYVMYTSGSTGEPRGVVATHAGLVNHNLAVVSLFGLSPADRVLQFSSLSFDIAIEEIFPAWVCGATVVFRDELSLLSPSDFSRSVERERITVLDLPTAYWHVWVEGLARIGERLPAPLRLVVVGGEKASARRFADWRAIGGDRVRWINTYGPTEATVVATAFEPEAQSGPGWDPVELPIGRPIANCQAYVLDGRLELCPVGVPGELYIGGAGLARCYLHQPRLTGDRFVPNSLSDQPGARLFRTGDRARWLPDGQLQFLGRVDCQVKIRGFRVEPAEIEGALRNHPRVVESVVEVCGETAGSQRLVAYVELRGGAEDGPADLRRWLHSVLPDYMVPSAFVVLEALPISSNGKVDRKALRAMGPGPAAPVAKYVAPRDVLDETLAAVWAEVLGLEQVGIHDNFFDLGGHSLQSVQLVSRLAAALNRPIPVKTVFQGPTIAAMADILKNEAAAGNGLDRSDGNGTPQAAVARLMRGSEPAVLPEHVSIERRPLLSLFASGELAAVESVAVGYLPSDILHLAGLDRATVIHDWLANRPLVSEVRQTRLGSTASVLIPRFDDQLYQDRRDLLAVLGDALRVAGDIGARTVSLTGLLPSACDYGRALAESLSGQDHPAITTGHATTTSAVVLAVRKALEEGGRDLSGEHVGFIGLGSVGIATLRLLLSCLGHPARLSLCDVYSKQESLESLRRELSDELGYGGEVRLLASRHEVPSELYEASLIVGATNVAEILDIRRVAPGTIVVDDSAPHAFRSEDALRRFQERRDILVTEGGVLRAPEPLPLLVYAPDELEPWLRDGLVLLISQNNPWHITGCVLSGLLSAKFAHLAPTIGLIDPQTARDHYEMLESLRFGATGLELEGTPLDEQIVGEFRARYGSSRCAGYGNRQ